MRTAVRSPLGAALGVLVAVASLTGPASPVMLSGIVAVLSIMIAIGWPDLVEVESQRGTRIVVVAIGVLGAAATLLSPAALAPLQALAMICGIGVFAAFVHQMLRSDRRGLTVSLTATVAGMLLAGLGSTWVIAGEISQATGTSGVVTATGIALAIAGLVSALELPGSVRLVAGAVLGGGAGAALFPVLTDSGPLTGLAVGLAASVGAMGVTILLQSLLVSREPGPSLTVAAAPVATVGMVALLAVTLLG